MRRLICLSALMLISACGQGGSNEPAAAPQATGTAEPAPAATKRGLIRDFAGTSASAIALETGPDGRTETIADIVAAHPGQKILVNLWATWCAPCLVELPTLDALAAATKGQLVVVPVSQDMEGWQKVSPAFTAEKYPNLSTRLESRTMLAAEMQAQGLPLTILYGPDGKEVWRYAGDRNWNSAESRAMMAL